MIYDSINIITWKEIYSVLSHWDLLLVTAKGVHACLCPGATIDQFNEAKSRLSNLKKDPGNNVKLKIYALFKQVSNP